MDKSSSAGSNDKPVKSALEMLQFYDENSSNDSSESNIENNKSEDVTDQQIEDQKTNEVEQTETVDKSGNCEITKVECEEKTSVPVLDEIKSKSEVPISLETDKPSVDVCDTSANKYLVDHKKITFDKDMPKEDVSISSTSITEKSDTLESCTSSLKVDMVSELSVDKESNTTKLVGSSPKHASLDANKTSVAEDNKDVAKITPEVNAQFSEVESSTSFQKSDSSSSPVSSKIAQKDIDINNPVLKSTLENNIIDSVNPKQENILIDTSTPISKTKHLENASKSIETNSKTDTVIESDTKIINVKTLEPSKIVDSTSSSSLNKTESVENVVAIKKSEDSNKTPEIIAPTIIAPQDNTIKTPVINYESDDKSIKTKNVLPSNANIGEKVESTTKKSIDIECNVPNPKFESKVTVSDIVVPESGKNKTSIDNLEKLNEAKEDEVKTIGQQNSKAVDCSNKDVLQSVQDRESTVSSKEETVGDQKEMLAKIADKESKQTYLNTNLVDNSSDVLERVDEVKPTATATVSKEPLISDTNKTEKLNITNKSTSSKENVTDKTTIKLTEKEIAANVNKSVPTTSVRKDQTHPVSDPLIIKSSNGSQIVLKGCEVRLTVETNIQSLATDMTKSISEDKKSVKVATKPEIKDVKVKASNSTVTETIVPNVKDKEVDKIQSSVAELKNKDLSEIKTVKEDKSIPTVLTQVVVEENSSKSEDNANQKLPELQSDVSCTKINEGSTSSLPTRLKDSLEQSESPKRVKLVRPKFSKPQLVKTEPVVKPISFTIEKESAFEVTPAKKSVSQDDLIECSNKLGTKSDSYITKTTIKETEPVNNPDQQELTGTLKEPQKISVCQEEDNQLEKDKAKSVSPQFDSQPVTEKVEKTIEKQEIKDDLECQEVTSSVKETDVVSTKVSQITESISKDDADAINKIDSSSSQIGKTPDSPKRVKLVRPVSVAKKPVKVLPQKVSYPSDSTASYDSKLLRQRLEEKQVDAPKSIKRKIDDIPDNTHPKRIDLSNKDIIKPEISTVTTKPSSAEVTTKDSHKAAVDTMSLNVSQLPTESDTSVKTVVSTNVPDKSIAIATDKSTNLSTKSDYETVPVKSTSSPVKSDLEAVSIETTTKSDVKTVTVKNISTIKPIEADKNIDKSNKDIPKLVQNPVSDETKNQIPVKPISPNVIIQQSSKEKGPLQSQEQIIKVTDINLKTQLQKESIIKKDKDQLPAEKFKSQIVLQTSTLKKPDESQNKQLEYTLKIGKDSAKMIPKDDVKSKAAPKLAERIVDSDVTITPIIGKESKVEGHKATGLGNQHESKGDSDKWKQYTDVKIISVSGNKQHDSSNSAVIADKKIKQEAQESAVLTTSSGVEINLQNTRPKVLSALITESHASSSSSDDVQFVKIIKAETNSSVDPLDPAMPQDVQIKQEIVSAPLKRRRGRPRKIPLEARPQMMGDVQHMDVNSGHPDEYAANLFPVPLFDMSESMFTPGHTLFPDQVVPSDQRPQRTCRGRGRLTSGRPRRPRGSSLGRVSSSGRGRGRGYKRRFTEDEHIITIDNVEQVEQEMKEMHKVPGRGRGRGIKRRYLEEDHIITIDNVDQEMMQDVPVRRRSSTGSKVSGGEEDEDKPVRVKRQVISREERKRLRMEKIKRKKEEKKQRILEKKRLRQEAREKEKADAISAALGDEETRMSAPEAPIKEDQEELLDQLVQSKRLEGVEDAEPPTPKRRREHYFCCICLEEAPLRKLTSPLDHRSWTVLYEAAIVRQFEPILKLTDDHAKEIPGTVLYHRNCRSEFTHKKTLAKLTECTVGELNSADQTNPDGTLKDFSVDHLAEYQWPPQVGELYMIQEQISTYLGVLSFKRKYPDITRRSVEMEERQYLTENGLVSESLCDLAFAESSNVSNSTDRENQSDQSDVVDGPQRATPGEQNKIGGLTAVNSAEVLDIMFADFPEKYEEYRKCIRDKQARELSSKQKAALCSLLDKKKLEQKSDSKQEAMQSAASWNSNLNKARREQRRCSLDLQSFVVHYPKTKCQKMTSAEPRKVGNYPVALIPGQYCDFYKRYTPDELRYFPLDTVLYGPILPNERHGGISDGSQSDSDDSSSSDDSSDTSSEGTQDTEGTCEEENKERVKEKVVEEVHCKVCGGDKTRNKQDQPEILMQCAQCAKSSHLTCVGLAVSMAPHLRRYDWQCTDCKNCAQCKDPADEDKMLFCDLCDRGYHIYCVGLRKVPHGRWHCQVCSLCNSCGTTDPGGPDWQHEYKKEKLSRIYIQTLCGNCSKLWRKGRFCQLCLRCYATKPEEDPDLVQCSACDRWMHVECCRTYGGGLIVGGSGILCETCQERALPKSLPRNRP